MPRAEGYAGSGRVCQQGVPRSSAGSGRRQAGELVALDVGRYDDPDCSIRWRGSKGSYIDCDGNRLDKTDMARHPVTVKTSGKQKGGVFVDLDTLDPPSGAVTATTTP